MSTRAPELDVTTLEPRGHSTGALGVHPYFGRVDPALAHALIQSYSHPGETILDPFCGSGTVLHEAIVSGRSAIGWDSSPLAVGISLAKLSSPTSTEIAAVTRLTDRLIRWSAEAGPLRETVPGGYAVPEMPRVQSISSWFGEVALRELAFIRHILLESQSSMPQISRLLAWIAFSRIVTRASNQQGESSYRRIAKEYAPGDIISLFRTSANHVCRAVATQSALLGKREATDTSLLGGKLAWAQQQSLEVEVHDSRKTHGSSKAADLVVTSPPYLMSWDYGLYHKFRFYWLGLDLDQYEETEIGRHLRRQQDDVERYREDMAATFIALTPSIGESGRIAMVNSPSVVHGRLVDTNAILVDCAQAAGWKLEDCRPSLMLTGPHHGMYASLKARRTAVPGRSGKQEHVLIFSREGG